MNDILVIFVLLVKTLLMPIVRKKKVPAWAIVRIYFIIWRAIFRRFDYKYLGGVMIPPLGEITEMLRPVLPEQKAHMQILFILPPKSSHCGPWMKSPRKPDAGGSFSEQNYPEPNLAAPCAFRMQALLVKHGLSC